MHFVYIYAQNSIYDIPWTLFEMGYKGVIYDEFQFDPIAPIAFELEKLKGFLLGQKCDFVISYLFIPEISDMCQELGYKYVCWIYDSPLVALYHRAVRNSCNYIFVFDHSEYQRMKTLQIPHLYYLPMGANISRTGALDITREDEEKFGCEISFVGSLYEDNAYNRFIGEFPAEIAVELKHYLVKNLCQWNEKKTWPRVSPKVCEFIRKYYPAQIKHCFEMEFDLYLGILLLSRKLAQMERITVLNVLAQKHQVDLYTTSDGCHLENVRIHNRVDYYTEMTKIFYLSRINLNITLPSIETGIPQRVFDIMGSGGFVLTNYQQEIDDFFEIGKEIEVFHTLDELKEKVDYYLSHEEERLRIAINGYKKVRDCFTYKHQMKKILEIVQG